MPTRFALTLLFAFLLALAVCGWVVQGARRVATA
jgi:hypothetical protein